MLTEQALLERVVELIEVGHHLDEVPGAGMDDPGIPAGYRRLFQRGTAEFAAAAAAGLLDRLPPPPPPAEDAAIVEVEALLGAALPAVLRGLYRIANGGFGPGYGLLGLRGGHTDDTARTALDLLRAVRRGRWPGMPSGLLPMCHWGCGIYSLVHCPSGRIYGYDPNPLPHGQDVPFFEQEYTVTTWLQAWLDGTLHQPWLIYEPEAGVCRGATIEETRAAMADVLD